MHLTIDNCAVVYFRIISGGIGNHAEILQLAAKRRNGIFSVWIEPSRPMRIVRPLNISASMRGEQLELFYCEQKLPAVPLKTALFKFLKFLKLAPKPVLLVTHSASLVLPLLLRAILETSMTDMFDGVIAAFADTNPILKEKIPYQNLTAFQSSITIQDKFLKPLHNLKCLETVAMKHISKMELIESSMSYEAAITKEMEKVCVSRVLERLKPLRSTVGWDNLLTLAQSGLSYSMMEGVYRDSGSKGLEEFLIEKQRKIKPARILGQDPIIKVVHFIEKYHAVDNVPHSDYAFDEEQKELMDEIDSFMETENLTDKVLDTKDFYTEEQQQKLTCDIDSLIQEQNLVDHQVPVNYHVPVDEQNKRDRERMQEWSQRLDPFY